MFLTRRRVIRGLIVIAGLLVLSSAGGYWYLLTQRSSLDARIRKIREAGEPTTPDELAAYYAEPAPEKNVTPLLKEALVLLRPTEPAFGRDGEYQALPYLGHASAAVEPPLPGSPWPDLPKAEKCLAERAPALRLIHQALDVGGAARFPVDFSKGTEALLQDTQSMRSITRLLSLELLTHAHRGKTAEATQSLVHLIRMHRTLEKEPLLISQLVRCALVQVAVEQVRTIVPRLDFTDAQLALLQRELTLIDLKEAPTRALIGDRAMFIITLSDPHLRNQRLGGSGFAALAEFGHAARMTFLIERLDVAVAATRLPWFQAIDQLAEFSRPTAVNSPLADAVYFNLAAPAMEVGVNGIIGAQVRTQLAAASMGIERKRRRTGKNGGLPMSLDELDPDLLHGVNPDIFSGQKLLVKSDSNSYRVYSVGFNRVDDGGIENEKSKLKDKLDLVFQVNIPPAAKAAPSAK